jgi:hypothetical protein
VITDAWDDHNIAVEPVGVQTEVGSERYRLTCSCGWSETFDATAVAREAAQRHFETVLAARRALSAG